MKPRGWMLALAVSAGLGSVSFGQVTGSVNFEGEAPEAEQVNIAAVKECAKQHPDGLFADQVTVTDGKLANVVVSVKTDDAAALGGEAPTEPAKLDQKGCQYVPHVLGVMVGQPLIVANSDPFLHNVHSLAIDNPAFNFGQPNIDNKPGKKIDPMKTVERFKIKCDVHPWMNAQVSVFEHPYFAVSGEDGTFELPAGLPDGDYTLVAWHESLGEKEIMVSVKDGKAEGADFSFSAESAAADKADAPAEVTLASFEQKASGKASAKADACDHCDKDAKPAVAEKADKAAGPRAAAK